MPEENYTSKFRVDVSDLKKGLSDANQAIKKANAEFKNATAGTKDWEKSADGLTAAITSQRKVIEEEEKKLSLLKEQLSRVNKAQEDGKKAISELNSKYDDAVEKYGATSEEAKKYAKQLSDAETAQERNRKAAEKLEIQVINQDTALKNAKAKASDYQTALDKLGTEEEESAKSADKLSDEIEDTGKQAQKTTDGGLNAFTVALGNLAANVLTKVIDKLGEAVEKIVDVGKQSLEAYSSYEQLVGGVETLFGESADKVQQYADRAFETAGLSANAYMETVTGFSASLIQSLNGDTAKAADVADKAITDMSDNANKMGSDMASLQNAYQGFAKQNYTMLDNLKLGYGGTKEEMQRLLDDASQLSGIDFSIESYADIIEAIHVIQDEIGITGTTAKEASTTIEGSTSAMKAAWDDLKVEAAKDNGDISGSVEKLGNALTTVLKNILPRVNQIMSGLEEVIVSAIPLITDTIEQNAPQLIESLTSVLQNLLNGATGIIPAIISTGSLLVSSLITGILKAAPDVVKTLADSITLIISSLGKLIPDIAYKFLDALPLFMEALSNAVPQIIEGVVNLITQIVNRLPQLLEKALKTAPKVWNAIASAIKNSLPRILEAVRLLIQSITSNLPEIMDILTTEIPNIIAAVAEIISSTYPVIIESAIKIVQALVAALPEIMGTLNASMPELVEAVGQALIDNAPLLVETAKTVWSLVLDAIPPLLESLWDILTTSITAQLDAISVLLAPAAKWVNDNVFKPIIEFFSPVIEFFKKAFNTIGELAQGCWTLIKTVWGAAVTWFDDNVAAPVKNLFSAVWDKLKEGAASAWDGIKSVFSAVADFFEKTFGSAWQKVKDIFSEHGEVFEGIKDGIVDTFTTIVNGLINGINSVVSVPFENLNSILDKLHDMEVLGVKPFESLVTRIEVPQIPMLEYGGILKRGQRGFLEGKNDEAVIPLQNNTEGLRRIAGLLSAEMGTGTGRAGGGGTVNNYTFTQTNNSPKPLSRWDIYRQTRNLINAMKGV